jgi:Methyltransferase domain
LHVGGEPRLREKLARFAIDWTFVDETQLDPILRRPGAAPFQLIVCNQILATVANPTATIHCLAHALADSGWLVAQSLFAPTLKRTLAFTVEPTKRAAQLFFGSDRARRLFGSDLAQIFMAAGLQGGPYRHEDVLPGVDGATWGCDPREPFFLFSRTRCLTSPS